jgi:hypothetical protein
MTDPVVLQETTSGAYQGIAIDDTWVYFGQDSMGVRRVPKAGGAVEDFVRGDAEPIVLSFAPESGLVVDSMYVYWLVDSTGVFRVPTASFSVSSPTLVAPMPTSTSFNVELRGFTVGGGEVYFGNVTDQIAESATGSTTGSVLSLGGGGFVDAIAADSAGAFFANDISGIYALSPGGTPTLLTAGYAWWISIDATTVYFTDNALGIRKIDRAATSSATTLAPAPGLATSIAIDNTLVYWGEGAGDGGTPGVRQVSKTGGSVSTIAPGTAATAIATDATCVYYVDAQHVMRVPKWAGTPH